MRSAHRPGPARLIISGGPGSGKTALIEALASIGEVCCPEISRELIRDQMSQGGDAVPWHDLDAFSRECSLRMLAQLATCDTPRRVFLDRGLPDLIGYLRCAGRQVPDTLRSAATLYTPLVFLAPPWREIYVNDTERPQTYSDAKALSRHIRATYDELGFEIIDLERESVAARVARIRAVLTERKVI